MNTIKLNDVEVEVISYNRQMTFSEDMVKNRAYFGMKQKDLDLIIELFDTEITSIEIYHDDEKIYDLKDISVHLDNISEDLMQDTIVTNVNLIFDN